MPLICSRHVEGFLGLHGYPSLVGLWDRSPARPLFSPRGDAKYVRGQSVQGARHSATSGTAWRAATFLNPMLSMASKRNEVMAGLIACFGCQVARNAA